MKANHWNPEDTCLLETVHRTSLVIQENTQGSTSCGNTQACPHLHSLCIVENFPDVIVKFLKENLIEKQPSQLVYHPNYYFAWTPWKVVLKRRKNKQVNETNQGDSLTFGGGGLLFWDCELRLNRPCLLGKWEKVVLGGAFLGPVVCVCVYVPGWGIGSFLR